VIELEMENVRVDLLLTCSFLVAQADQAVISRAGTLRVSGDTLGYAGT